MLDYVIVTVEDVAGEGHGLCRPRNADVESLQREAVAVRYDLALRKIPGRQQALAARVGDRPMGRLVRIGDSAVRDRGYGHLTPARAARFRLPYRDAGLVAERVGAGRLGI